MTLHRHQEEYGMLPELSHSISDGQLDKAVQNLRQELPDIGQSMVSGTYEQRVFKCQGTESEKQFKELIP